MDWLQQKTLGLFVKTGGVLSRPLFGGLGHIFMLHRVLPAQLREQYTINRSLAITPEYLERTINWFRNRGYRFVSLDEVYEILKTGKKPKQRFVCLTLDDGYLDNLQYGLPLFKKLEVPVTIYVTNCFPNGTAILWWYLLEKTIQEKNHLTLKSSKGEQTFKWSDPNEGEKQFHTIRDAIRSIPRSEFRKSLLEAFGLDEQGLAAMNTGLFLSWDDIRSLSKEPLVTIGAHTMNHLSLTSLTPTEMEEEIQASRSEIEKQIGQAVQHFAYPYGGIDDAGPREYKMVAELGFHAATLNVPGNVFLQQASNTECLPRMGLSDSTSKERLEHISNGILHFSNHGFKRTFAP